ncbi:MAG: peptide chain release factor N(5)-glutamine methyltransferase [Bacilli bacterium]|nr:peptide chain release factor N(5)-glutamine methyltransferase [Bacilli bacterium]
MKYKELIEYANNNHRIKDYEQEAIYFLIQELEGISRSELLMKLNDEVNNDELIHYVDEYIYHNKPVQYLLRKAYFYDSYFYVDENVLIPRFDTEFVLEKTIELIEKKYNHKIDICDLCTGSGCIAVILKKHIDCDIDAIDISKEAILVAKKNILLNNVDVKLIQNDLLDGIDKVYDIIISNPPYIDKDEYVMDIVYQNEPHLALFSEDKGLYHYKRIIDQSLNNLKDNGTLIFEIPDNKCDMIKEYASRYYDDITYYKDFNNQRRIMIIESRKKK